MCIKLKASEINGLIQGVALTANAFKDIPVWYECYLDILEYDKTHSFEENIKFYFKQQSIDYVARIRAKELANNEWQFKLKENQYPEQTVYDFFHGNMFSNIDSEQMEPVYNELYLEIESCFGEILLAKAGYIHPIEEMNIYCQHWQHLYIQTKQHHLLITFEANS